VLLDIANCCTTAGRCPLAPAREGGKLGIRPLRFLKKIKFKEKEKIHQIIIIIIIKFKHTF
jgi:hypothetical protein